MNELKVQAEIIKAARELDAHAFKANNRFMKGVPDLSIKLPKYAHTWIEVKFERRFSSSIRLKRPDLIDADWRAYCKEHTSAVNIDLTPHQRRFLRDERSAGGSAGWLMVVAQGNGGYWLCCSFGLPSHGVLYLGSDWMEKPRGGKWPVEAIVNRLQY